MDNNIITKNILYDIMRAFCMDFENINKVQKMAGVTNSIWNGQRDREDAAKILTRAIPEGKAQQIINKMPFPFINNYYPGERRAQEVFTASYTASRSQYWIDTHLFIPSKPKRINIEIMPEKL